jgi:hypothetical protein
VVASEFTTQSATAVLENMREQIHAATPEPADPSSSLGDGRAYQDTDAVLTFLFEFQGRQPMG